MKVLVTDAMFKHTLGVIRSLGKNDIYVIAGWTTKHAMAFYSRYCKEKIVYPTPQNEDGFIQFMTKIVKDNKIDVLLPISYAVSTVLSKHKEEFCNYTKLPIADWNSMEIACNKDKTMQFAESVGVEIPKTYKELDEIKDFPVVVKGIGDASNVRYINSSEELSKIKKLDSIAQEYIPGDGYGFYALFNNGKERAFFMHKRIREYPVTGGPSTCAESIFDPMLRDAGLKLLRALNWHGVAMVEFKKDSRDGKFKLMEINPKYWGSLDLSIASGINFPFLTVKMAADGDIEPVYKYNVGTKFRWLCPDDILHLLAKPSSVCAFFRDFFDKNTKGNIWMSDLKPNLFQILILYHEMISRRGIKNFKFPHGIPMVKS